MGLFLLFVVGVSGVSLAQAQMPALHGDAMLDCSGLPCLGVTLANGKHLRMLIDTGDETSVLDTTVAKAMGIELTPVKGADGKEIAGYNWAVLAGAKAGDGSLGDVKVLTMDLSNTIKKDKMPAADGSLTYTAFKDRVLEMDYVGKRIRFSEPLTKEIPCPGSCGTLTTPTFGNGRPHVLVATGFSVNEKPITAQIDSLYSGTMLIYPTSVEKLGLSEAAKSTKKRMFKYTDGGVDMLEAGPAAEGFLGRSLGKDAAVYFATPAVHVPDGMFDGTVGQELLEHSVLMMDLKGMRVWIG